MVGNPGRTDARTDARTHGQHLTTLNQNYLTVNKLPFFCVWNLFFKSHIFFCCLLLFSLLCCCRLEHHVIDQYILHNMLALPKGKWVFVDHRELFLRWWTWSNKISRHFKRCIRSSCPPLPTSLSFCFDSIPHGNKNRTQGVLLSSGMIWPGIYINVSVFIVMRGWRKLPSAIVPLTIKLSFTRPRFLASHELRQHVVLRLKATDNVGNCGINISIHVLRCWFGIIWISMSPGVTVIKCVFNTVDVMFCYHCM